MTIWLINVVAALYVFARLDEDAGFGFRWFFKWTFSRLRLTLGLVWRAIIVLPGVIICAALLVRRSFRVKIGHALAWTESDCGESESIEGFVRSAIEAVDANKRILVGHSQGGSILATISESGALGKGNPLLTLGSGHALLATQKVLGARRRTVPTALLLALLFIGAMLAFAVQLVSLLVVFVQGVGHITSAALWLASGWWVSGIDPAAAESRYSEAAAASIEYTLSSWLKGTDVAISSSLGAFVFLSLMVWWGRATTASLHADIVAKNRTDVTGFDLIARHDPVSSALELLGNQDRIVRVSQTDSVVLDHVTYFGNGLVLSEICRVIESAAQGGGGREAAVVESSLSEVGYELRSGLIARRWASFGIAATMGAIVIRILGPQPIAFAVALGAIAMTATAGVYARRSWLDRMTTLGGFDDYRRATDLGRIRAARRSSWMASAQGVCALVLLSFAVVPTILPSVERHELMALEAPAMGVRTCWESLKPRLSCVARVCGPVEVRGVGPSAR
ncbi:hypothetical protein ACWEK5_50030, partial [Rhodococcus koreensis]